MPLIERKTILDGLYKVNKYLSYTPVISALVAFFDQIVLKPIFERCNVNKNEHKFFRLILEKDKWDNGKLFVPIWNIFEARVLFQKKEKAPNNFISPEKNRIDERQNTSSTNDKNNDLAEYFEKPKEILSKEFISFFSDNGTENKKHKDDSVSGTINQFFQVSNENPGKSACSPIALCATIKLLRVKDFESIDSQMVDEIIRKGVALNCYNNSIDNCAYHAELEKDCLKKMFDLGVLKKTEIRGSIGKPFFIECDSIPNRKFEFERAASRYLYKSLNCWLENASISEENMPLVLGQYLEETNEGTKARAKEDFGMVIIGHGVSVSIVIKAEKQELWLFDSHGLKEPNQRGSVKKLDMRRLSVKQISEEIISTMSGGFPFAFDMKGFI